MKWIVGALLGLFLLAMGLYGYFLRTYTTAVPPTGGNLRHGTLEVDNLRRSFSFYLPDQLPEESALVFVLHGSLERGKDIRWKTAYGFDRLAESDHFIPVYPDGFERHWNDCRASASYAANKQNVDDPAFFAAMVSYFEQRYKINPEQVFATGFSNGAQMVYRLALETPELVKAIAPISANLPISENNDCEARGAPVSIAVFNGTNDTINPYGGGLVEILGDRSRGIVLSSDQTLAYWRGLAGGPPKPEKFWQVKRPDSDVLAAEVTQWSSNAGGRTELLRLYKLLNSGHVVPSAKVHFGHLLGGNMPAIEAADEIWGFFKKVGEVNKQPAMNWRGSAGDSAH